MKPKIIDYRINYLESPPPGIYPLQIVEFLFDGRAVLEIVDGPYRGIILIGGMTSYFNKAETLH